jgi:ribosomal protein L35AE/L33A
MFCRVKTGSGDDAKTYTGAEMVNELLTPLQTGGKEAVEAGALANCHGRQAAHKARRRYELGLPGKILGNDGGKPKILMGPQEIEHLPLPFKGGQ